jgi:hypothetical protein
LSTSSGNPTPCKSTDGEIAAAAAAASVQTCGLYDDAGWTKIIPSLATLLMPRSAERRTTYGRVGVILESPPQRAAALLGPSIITGGEQGVFAPLLFMA